MNIISLFSGAGGMDLGFQRVGFNIVWANDFNKDATETYKNNIGDHITLGDITEININDIASQHDDIDVVIGGFPCQGFSVSNNSRSMEDERNFLYLELLRVIRDKRPKFFVLENVRGLLSMEDGKVIDMIVDDFINLGYDVDYKLLNSADYGAPQSRERVIIVGNRLGLVNPFPKRSHSDNPSDNLRQHLTASEAIGHMAKLEPVNGKIKEYVFVNGEKVYNHVANTNVKDTFFGRKYDVKQGDVCDYLRYWRKESGWTIKAIDEHLGYRHTAGHWFRKDRSGSIPKPSDWWALKKILNFDDRMDDLVTEMVEKRINFDQNLRIVNWDRPSATITASTPPIHVNKERRLSARECAMLQTFPDDFVFVGSMSSMYQQIGNAVPPLLAEKIALSIRNSLNNEEEI